ncbi:MAG: hypothetical protein GX491_16125 [Chloroflexi bacterium]|nr:hypothetical protein [Chloroflexota bacterium]
MTERVSRSPFAAGSLLATGSLLVTGSPLASGSPQVSLATLRDHQPPIMERPAALRSIFEITNERCRHSFIRFREAIR